MPTSTLTSKGQITVPKKIREALRLEPGDQIDFVLQDDGRVVVQAGSVDVLDLKGLLRRRRRKPVSLREMEAAIARAHPRRK